MSNTLSTLELCISKYHKKHLVILPLELNGKWDGHESFGIL